MNPFIVHTKLTAPLLQYKRAFLSIVDLPCSFPDAKHRLDFFPLGNNTLCLISVAGRFSGSSCIVV